MKTNVALAALLLAAVAVAQQDQRPDRRAIDVQVVDGRIVVEEVVDTDEKEGALVWHLTQKEFAFPDNGIVIASQGQHAPCRVVANGRGVRCAKLHHIHGARYKYTINVIDAGSQKPLPPLDPWIHNT